MSDELELHTILQNGKLTTTTVGNAQDRELIGKLIETLQRENVSVGKAMAILDATRTAMLRRVLGSDLGSLRIED